MPSGQCARQLRAPLDRKPGVRIHKYLHPKVADFAGGATGVAWIRACVGAEDTR